MVVTFACTECKERNYTSEKNRKNEPVAWSSINICPRCRDAYGIPVADKLIDRPGRRTARRADCPLRRPVAQLAERRSPKP